MILCSAMILATFMNSSISHAATEDELITQGLVVYEPHEDVETYRVNKTYPDAQTEGDYAFAGWYYKEGTVYKPYSVTGVDNATTAYAKFVDADVFGAKFQVIADTTTESFTTDLRMVSSIDSFNYTSVGFKVTFNNKTLLCNTVGVYSTINVYVDDNNEPYEPADVFSDASMCFATHRINGITNDAFDKEFIVQPTWTTLDGTTVEAKADKVRTITVDEMADEYVVDFENGLDFENVADETMISGSTGSNLDTSYSGETGENKATTSRVVFDNSNVIKLSSTYTVTPACPTIHVDFGKTYPVGSTLTFRYYIEGDGNADTGIRLYQENQTSYKQTTGNPSRGQWHTKTITFDQAYNRMSMFITVWSLTTNIYFDDFKIETPVDFETGVTFEREKDMGAFTASSNGSYSSRISCEEYEGSNRLLMTSVNSGGQYPLMTLAFGKTYPVGTKLSFKVKAVDCGTGTQDFWVNSVTKSFARGAWNTITYTFTSERSSIDINSTVWNTNYKLYFDDFKIETPVDFETGVTFEREKDMEAFTASSNGSYSSRISCEEYEGSNRLLMTSVNSGGQYPLMTLAFGKTYPVGTKLSFKVKAVDCGTGTQDFWVNSVTKSFARGAWNTITYTFTSERSSIDINSTVWNTNYKLYFDDFKIEVPSN